MEIGNTLAKNITAAGEKTAYENNLLWEIFFVRGKTGGRLPARYSADDRHRNY